jgi:hypothetical protein
MEVNVSFRFKELYLKGNYPVYPVNMRLGEP